MIRCPDGPGVNSCDRMEVVLRNRAHMDLSAWLTQLGEQWEGCDRIDRCRDELTDTLRGLNRCQLDQIMDEAELKAHRLLPELVLVWRGCYDFNRDGLSWSLSRDIAAGFTSLNRYRHAGLKPLLLSRWVRREDVVLKLGRDEQEVIAHTLYETEALAAIGGAV
jgi:hypothetical protein